MKRRRIAHNHLWKVTFFDESTEKTYSIEGSSWNNNPHNWLVDRFIKEELDRDLLKKEFKGFQSLTQIDLVNKEVIEYDLEDLNLNLIHRLIEEYFRS